MRFRYSLCNECFEETPFLEVCRAIKKAGFAGIEIAPFTLSAEPATISAADRAGYRQMMADEGLEFVGLHWLMVAPAGLHVTTPDAALRQKSWEHIGQLIDLCADLGDGGVMVFGSPKQRGTVGGATVAEATGHYVEGLRGVAGRAASRGVRVLVEALPKGQCDVITTLAEAVAVVDAVGSPAVSTMFDTHNAVDEVEAHAGLVERYFDRIEHVHVNELDGKHPGRGDYDFRAVLEVLARRGYGGWVSVEAFDFSFGGEVIARESRGRLGEAEG